MGEPEPITEEDFEALRLKSNSSFRTFWESQSNKDQVFVDCCSTSNIEIKYFPIQEGSNVPIVAIQASGLSSGMKYDIKCKAYYKGVKFTTEDKYNSVVEFQLEMIAPV